METCELPGYSFLNDDEIIELGDAIRDDNFDEWREVRSNTIDGLLQGMTVARACDCQGIVAVARRNPQ